MRCVDHVFVTAEVVDAPESHRREIGTILTVCAVCGYIAGAEK